MCAQSTCGSFRFKRGSKTLQKPSYSFGPCICTHDHSGQQQICRLAPPAVAPALTRSPENSKVRMKHTHLREAGLRKHKPQLAETQATAHSPRGRKAGAVLSPPAGRALILAVPPPERSESRRSDLGEFNAGNCSGSLALSSLYPSGLPAMMTALLALNCLTEHEGWSQLAPARGRARCACTAKICGSSAVGFKGGRTKSLGAAPCITNLRNSLWFPLRAIRELYIVLCLELKILVSKTSPVLHHRIHLIFARG